jgi:hypothetical protein
VPPSVAAGTVLGAVFCLLLSRGSLRLETLSQAPHFGLPAIPAFRHLRQAVLQTLVLPFGCLALGLPSVTTPPEEAKQLGNRTAKRQRFTDRHWTTSVQRPKELSEDKPTRQEHKTTTNGTKLAKEGQISFLQ